LFSRERSSLDEGSSALLVSSNSGLGGNGTDAECRSDGSEGCERSGKNSSANERANGCQLMWIRSKGDGGDAGLAGGRFRSRVVHLLGNRSGSEKLRLGWSRGGGSSGRPTLAGLSSIVLASSTKARNLCCDVGPPGGVRGGAARLMRDLERRKPLSAADQEAFAKVGCALRFCVVVASTARASSRRSEPVRRLSQCGCLSRTSSRCPRGSICIRSWWERDSCGLYKSSWLPHDELDFCFGPLSLLLRSPDVSSDAGGVESMTLFDEFLCASSCPVISLGDCLLVADRVARHRDQGA